MSRSRYTEIKDKLVKGAWIFTCSMEPQQFGKFDIIKAEDYDENYIKSLSPEELDDFLHDGFETMAGSSHSIYHCSCSPISEKYATWFNENEIWNLFDEDNSDNKWDIYVTKVKKLCEEQGIEYEGI